MVGRGKLTDKAWARIEPLLPPVTGRGRRWRDHRQVINAILWKLRTGAPWPDLPERYGPWKTAHERRIWVRGRRIVTGTSPGPYAGVINALRGLGYPVKKSRATRGRRAAVISVAQFPAKLLALHLGHALMRSPDAWTS